MTGLLEDRASCRTVLKLFGSVPSLAAQGSSHVPACVGASAASVGAQRRPAEGMVCGLRVATWNVAGGLTSAQAPPSWSSVDQANGLMAELRRWRSAFQCDVLALQECENAGGYEELLEDYE